jgi:hypothetical protein
MPCSAHRLCIQPSVKDKLSRVSSLSVLGAALAKSGIYRDQAIELDAALGAKKYLRMVRGNDEDLAKVNCALANSTN